MMGLHRKYSSAMHAPSWLLLHVLVAICLVSRPAVASESERTLHVAFPVGETGFDPQALGDTYSFTVCDAIFDTLYTYDYFARPARLVPKTAAALPEITDGGRTYTIRIRPGIYFAADPAFKGQRRELV